MPSGDKIDFHTLARRVAQEFSPGQVVALGPGMSSLVANEVPPSAGVMLLADSGALGYVGGTGIGVSDSVVTDSSGTRVEAAPGSSIVSLMDHAAMLRGGHVDWAVLQAAQVSSSGDFVHWTSSAVPSLLGPGSAVDLASGAAGVIAIPAHTRQDGSPNIVSELSFPADGVGCVDLIVTDLAVIRVTASGLVLEEMAPGWSADDIARVTGAPLAVSGSIREFSADSGSKERTQAPSKVYPDGLAAVADIPDGATIMIDGFGGPGGMAHHLLVSLREHGARELTIISNTAGIARIINFGTPPGQRAIDHSILIDNNQVRKAVASYPVSPSASRPSSFELAYRRGEVELELVPQGTLAERLRAGGAGVAAFYTPTGVGTLIAEGKETRTIDGKEYVLEQGLRADFCLIRAHKADTLGNVVYRGTSRNFNPVMAPAASVTVVEVDEIVEAGDLDPEEIVTPGIYINRIVQRPLGFSPYE
jgi:3-oxoacid CoA-transferase A subunit/3-oxoacid CoA-transferase B subunit